MKVRFKKKKRRILGNKILQSVIGFLVLLFVLELISSAFIDKNKFTQTRALESSLDSWDDIQHIENPDGTFNHTHYSGRSGESTRDYTIVPDNFNIFLYGGSSVDGMVDIESSNLEYQMEWIFDDPTVQVFNFGVGGADSKSVKEHFARTIGLSPEVIVIYAGHNDYWKIGENIKDTEDKTDIVNYYLLKYSNIYRLIFYMGHRNKGNINHYLYLKKRTVEQDLIRFSQHAWDDDHRNLVILSDHNKKLIEQREQKAVSSFKTNIGEVINHAKNNDIKVLLVTPVSHPYVYEYYLAELSDDQSVSEFVSRYEDAQVLYSALELEQTRTLLHDLQDEYPDNGLVSVFLARVYTVLRDHEKAREFEIKTIDQNMRTHKAKSEINEVISGFEDKANGVYVLDFFDFFYYNYSIHGINYDVYFTDYLHPSEKLYRLMSQKVIEKLKEESILPD